MTIRDVRRLIAMISPQFNDIGEAIAGRLEGAFRNATTLRLLSFSIKHNALKPDVYEFFRSTEWFIVSVPDAHFGEGMERATIRKKNYVLPTPDVCYHATPSRNRESIEKLGLLPGYHFNKPSRGTMFADSPFYIYVSITEQEARGWCEHFKEEEFLIYPVEIGKTSVRLFIDPLSVDEFRDIVSGYILDAAHVPPHLLQTPILVRRF